MILRDMRTREPIADDATLTGLDQQVFTLVRWDEDFVWVRREGSKGHSDRSLDRYRPHFFGLEVYLG